MGSSNVPAGKTLAVVCDSIGALRQVQTPDGERFVEGIAVKPIDLAFSEFRGYEEWQTVAVSQNGTLIETILGNPAMIEAYKASRRHHLSE